jgi:hypothetical protein
MHQEGEAPMPTAQARIETDRAERYLVQLCQHASAMGEGGHAGRMHGGAHQAPQGLAVRADWSDRRGELTFPSWGTCVLTTDDTSLTLDIDAVDDEALRRIQEILGSDLDRFGRRDGLVVEWRD